MGVGELGASRVLNDLELMEKSIGNNRKDGVAVINVRHYQGVNKN